MEALHHCRHGSTNALSRFRKKDSNSNYKKPLPLSVNLIRACLTLISRSAQFTKLPATKEVIIAKTAASIVFPRNKTSPLADEKARVRFYALCLQLDRLQTALASNFNGTIEPKARVP